MVAVWATMYLLVLASILFIPDRNSRFIAFVAWNPAAAVALAIVVAWGNPHRGERHKPDTNLDVEDILVVLTLMAVAGMVVGLVGRLANSAPTDGTAALAFLIFIALTWLAIVRRAQLQAERSKID